MTGAFRSTPVSLLNLETGIEPIIDRWRYLATRYFIKLSNRHSNIAYKTLYRILNLNCEWLPKSTPAALALIRTIRNRDPDSFRAEPSDVSTVSNGPPWNEHAIPCSFFPMSKGRATQKPNEARALFASLLTPSSAHHLNIFTDASVDNQSAACAIHIPHLKVQKSWSIPNGVSTLNAELLAIEKAIRLVYEMDVESFTIYTDSKSSINCIQSPNTENELAIRVKDLIYSCIPAGINPSLYWIPSHIGIPDNEIADQLASAGRNHPTEGPLEYRLSPEEMAANYKRDWKKVLVTVLSHEAARLSAATRSKFGPYPWHVIKNRRLQSCLFRLRTGHNKLNLCVSKWDPNVDKYCLHGCPREEDAKHVIVECEEYSAQRRQLQAIFEQIDEPLTVSSALGLTPTDVIPAHVQFTIQKALCKFVVETGLVDRV